MRKEHEAAGRTRDRRGGGGADPRRLAHPNERRLCMRTGLWGPVAERQACLLELGGIHGSTRRTSFADLAPCG